MAGPFEIKDDITSSIESITSRDVDLNALMQSASSQSREPSEEQQSRRLDDTPISFKKDLSSKVIGLSDESLVLMKESDSIF